MRRVAAVLGLAAAGALAFAASRPAVRSVAAHSETVETIPAPGAVVSPSPATVAVLFTDPLAPASRIDVLDAAFADVTAGPTRVDGADPHRMTVGLLHDLPLGTYTVAWTAVDAGDGHATTGSYTFSVGNRATAGRPLGTGGQAMIVLAVLTLAVLGAAGVARRRTRPSAAALVAGWAAMTVLGGAVMGCAGDPAAVPAPPQAVGTNGATSGAPPDGRSDAPPASSAGSGGQVSSSSTAASEEADGVPIQISIAASDMAVGEERFAFAILDANNVLLPDVDANVTFFRLEGETAEPAGTVPATYYASRLPEAGTYVALTRFDRAGPWGVAISGTLPDGRAVAPNRVRFEVATRPRSPAVGDVAPPTANRTLATAGDIAALTSDPMPDPALYALTVDQAIATGKPTVVLFATPGYCQSRICTPVMDEIKALAGEWQGRVNFIHIEVYKSFSPQVLGDEMDVWGLTTEPWTFVLTGDGHVAARLEGNATQAELGPLLDRVTGGG